ncbi:vacuolar protein sorting-associated protein 26C-like [Portunus trituberculatus]|uniref:vacuolar protein sorting-associated protein 26C-like n=1 Tax=Portunus trituberculatus TaxID=210409 RepID=UPI001E1CF77B|nr:vacuolar protein sorting-associated protein 26C-like [Portunus trituberculatus]XP_045113904.1 vacuolar protein sorting-associated protein 26C-like [Portunus trituberculatus]
MSITIDIQLNRSSKIYHPGETVSGVVVVDSRSDTRHDGITLTMDGMVSIQLSPRSAGLLESIVSSSKPVPLLSHSVVIAKSGKLPAGQTELPFELPLAPRSTSKTLYETYHGIYITVHYCLHCDLKRSLLAKDVNKSQEFIVEYKTGTEGKNQMEAVNFEIRPETLQNVRDRARIPRFLVRGHLDSVNCPLSKPLTGELTVCECERGISSIELQLVRVETCGSSEGHTKEASEIQNIQIGEGDVCRGIAIPVYMLFPRLFTCTTTLAPNFKIEFELNIVIIFDNDHLVVETFPIKLSRT